MALSLATNAKKCDTAVLATPSYMDSSGRGQRFGLVRWAGLLDGSWITA